MFRIAHITDLHIPPLPRPPLHQLFSKRLLGFLSWHRKRKHEHRPEVLQALLEHLQKTDPDHICITGDLTNITLRAEVDTATRWLRRLGDPQRISLIPGNHDATVPRGLDYALSQWAVWMRDDDGNAGFPYVHYRGPVAIIGLSSAVATPPGLSLGWLGRAQLQRAEALFQRLDQQPLARILMVHHPPHNGACSRRRALSDREGLHRLLARHAVDMVLHGHLHYPVRSTLPGPERPIPVLGAAAGSATGAYKSRAHYHLIEANGAPGSLQFTVRHCHYDPHRQCFTEQDAETL